MTTEGTISGFQDFFLQPIIKDRPNNSITSRREDNDSRYFQQQLQLYCFIYLLIFKDLEKYVFFYLFDQAFDYESRILVIKVHFQTHVQSTNPWPIANVRCLLNVSTI